MVAAGVSLGRGEGGAAQDRRGEHFIARVVGLSNTAKALLAQELLTTRAQIC